MPPFLFAVSYFCVLLPCSRHVKPVVCVHATNIVHRACAFRACVWYNSFVRCCTLPEFNMVAKDISSLVDDTRSISFSHVERLYVQRSIDMLIASLQRSVKSETSSDVVVFREREIDALRDVRKRMGA